MNFPLLYSELFSPGKEIIPSKVKLKLPDTFQGPDMCSNSSQEDLKLWVPVTKQYSTENITVVLIPNVLLSLKFTTFIEK